jgi:glucosamine--fructose-6-phosphate aminotransferase (isomerizing)
VSAEYQGNHVFARRRVLYSGGALKHGPFALIENEEGKYGETPIIMIVLDDEHAMHRCTTAEEVRSRGAYTIISKGNQPIDV